MFVKSLTSLPFCTSESLPLLLKLPASYMHAQWCVQHQTHYPLIKKQQQNTQNGCLARKQGGDKYGCPKATWSSQQFLFLGSQKKHIVIVCHTTQSTFNTYENDSARNGIPLFACKSRSYSIPFSLLFSIGRRSGGSLCIEETKNVLLHESTT